MDIYMLLPSSKVKGGAGEVDTYKVCECMCRSCRNESVCMDACDAKELYLFTKYSTGFFVIFHGVFLLLAFNKF